jgi:hypothetical protein
VCRDLYLGRAQTLLSPVMPPSSLLKTVELSGRQSPSKCRIDNKEDVRVRMERMYAARRRMAYEDDLLLPLVELGERAIELRRLFAALNPGDPEMWENRGERTETKAAIKTWRTELTSL